ncbi:MAG: hypothetical protein IKJ11_07285 [Clostridia bacterium]|nr:hypothetical protein [Clostridia bacterium]
MSVLHEFYKGLLHPEEQRKWSNEEYLKRRERIFEQESDFCAGLTEEQRQAYIEIIDEYTGLLPCEAEEVYIEGMRMGAQLMQELLTKKDRPSLT